MRRYFYRANPFVKKILEDQLNALQHEENLFRASMLAHMRNRPKESLDALYNEVIEHTIQEQLALAQADHLQQLFTHFNGLHKAARRVDILYEQARFKREGIIDPDKFPISETHKMKKKWVSGWPAITDGLKKQLGFVLKVKPSSLQHVDSGRGVYIDGAAPAGTFMGFVPGHFYNNFKIFSKHKADRLKLKQYLHFPTNSILDFAKIDCWPCQHELDGSYLNPYALGELVNHPAPRTAANICFQQMVIPKGFFPSYYLKYLPIENLTNRDKDQSIPAIGMFSLRQLKSGEELFVNYLEHHVYPIEEIPEWLIEPPPLSVYLLKNEYEYIQWDFWVILERYALRHNRQHYEKFRNTVRYEPDRYEFEKEGKRYRKLNLVKHQYPQ